MKPPSFSHLIPLFFLNHANAFLSMPCQCVLVNAMPMRSCQCQQCVLVNANNAFLSMPTMHSCQCHANAFLILAEESGNRPISSITLASTTLRSLIVLCILALLATGIACPPLVQWLFLLCNKNKYSLFSSTTASISHVLVHFYEEKVISPLIE